jgi:desulfoferrodoxin (superoxide reductase-like protein)
MKIFILSLVVLPLFVSSVFAHAPKRVDITVSGKNISVSISHPVSNPQNHYVKRVEVFLNGKKIVEQTFSLQEGNYQELTYHIPSLRISDTVTVEAFCSIAGSQKKTIIVH